MNYQDMAAFVRKQADTDADDAPDLTLRVYARAAYNDIRRRVFPWPDKKTAFNFTTVPGQAFYPYTGMTAPDLDYVISVATPTDMLGYINPEQYLDKGGSSTGEPLLYSADVNGMYIHPTPTSAVQVSVVGYRKFKEWPISNADEPDLDRVFDEVICWYMLERYYEAQEDLELAELYARDYEQALNNQIEGALRGNASVAGPRIFGNQTLGNEFGVSTTTVWIS